MSRAAVDSVLIVGTGLLGASAGLALRALEVDVALSDLSPTAQALARDLGAGRVAGENEDPDLVMVCAPPDVVAGLVANALGRYPNALVTDVASVKSILAAELETAGADLTRYVGGHPMAGRERSGAIAARGDLFLGRPWVLTPGPSTVSAHVQRMRALASDLGAVPIVMDAAEHDAAVARISHVPQLAATLVAARLADTADDAVGLAGQGLRDVTRVAGSDPGLWVQILSGNPGPVAHVLHGLRQDLDLVIDALERLDSDHHAVGARADLARAFDAGNRGYARIPGKHGTAPTPLQVVTVQVPDRPGEISKVLQVMGEAGINLEDLRIEHVPGRLVGLAEISVLPASRERLEEVLRASGWQLAG
ncbi:MAG: prephenate dehydrogenase [Actinomycetales bacterium]